MDWASLASQLVSAGAPIVGSVLGGPLGGTIGGIIGKVVADALNVPATPEAVSAAIESNPQAPTILATMDATHGAELTELEARLKDTQDARAMQMSAIDHNTSLQWAPLIVSALNVAGFIAVSVIALFHPAGTDPGVALFLLGVWAGGFAGVNNFWLGSSSGSQRKDAQIGSALERAAAPAGRAVENAINKATRKP